VGAAHEPIIPNDAHRQEDRMTTDMEVIGPGHIAMNIPSSNSNRPKFKFRRACDLTAEPAPIKWLIKGLIEQEIVGLVFGAPASGKSLFALDWAFCCAAGLDWDGRPTMKTDAVIIAGEGFAGYSRRLAALEQKYGVNAPDNLILSEQSAQMQDPGCCDDIVKAIQDAGLKPGLIIIDTLNRNIAADENSSKDMAVFMSNIDRFFKPLGAAVLIIHHSGHGTDQRARGSSAIRAAMDAEYSVVKAENDITLACTKAKDFEPPKSLGFVLKPVCLNWSSEDGGQQTSVYLEYAGEAGKVVKKGKSMTDRDRNILQSLTDALREKGIEPTAEIRKKFGGFGTGTFKNVVSINDWREYAYKAISAKSDGANKKAFERFRETYLNSYLEEYDGYAWRIDLSDKLETSDSDKRQKQPTEEFSGIFDNLETEIPSDNKRLIDDASNNTALSGSDNKRQIATNPKVSHDDDATTATHPLRGVADVASQSTLEILEDDVSGLSVPIRKPFPLHFLGDRYDR
jgi:hypothetical protein